MSAAQLSLRPIKDIIIPVADICMIPQNSTLADALIRAHLDMHTRFPVCEDIHNPQTIHGYINFKDIIAALKINPEDPTIKGIIRPLKKFLDSTPISKVLERMIQEKLHIGLVENDQKQIIGMITQEDIIEELVGEIEDEFDRLPNYIHPYGNQWLVGGAVSMSTLAKTIGLDWMLAAPNEGDFKLADWCQKQFKKPFNGGEVIVGNGFSNYDQKTEKEKVSEAFVAKNHLMVFYFCGKNGPIRIRPTRVALGRGMQAVRGTQIRQGHGIKDKDRPPANRKPWPGLQ